MDRPATEEALLERTARGDAAAFRALFERHQAAVWRTAYGVLLDSAEASDVTQEVFMRLHHQAASWRPEAALRTWLYRVTLNEALGVRRRLRGFFRAPEAGRPGPSPEDQLAQHQTLAALRAGLGELSPNQRAAVTLHLDAGLQPAELAPLLGLSANAARVTLHRALERLRAQARAQGLEFPADDPQRVESAAEEA